MKLLIGYATTTGHTRKICQFIADRAFDGGHMVELLPLEGATQVDLGRFDHVILAASVHAGHYQAALTEFVTAHLDALRGMPDVFLAVSLSAAGHDAEDWRGLEHILEDFQTATGWTPDHVAQVAGAYLPETYDLIRRFMMKRIIKAKDPTADPDQDREYTDWAALAAMVDGWLR